MLVHRSRNCGFLSGPKALTPVAYLGSNYPYYYVCYYRPCPYPSSNAYAILHLGPPAENKTPRGSREQRGAKKYSQKKGVCGVSIPPMGPSVVWGFIYFFKYFFKTAKTAKWRQRSTFGRAPAAQNTKSEPNDCLHIHLSTRGNAFAMSKPEVWIRVLAPVGDENCRHSTRSHTSPK
jgi:hypothetical protein